MGFPIGRVLSLGLRVLSVIETAVPAVEAFATSMKKGTGAEKKQAVMTLVAVELQAAEQIVGRDLANDADVVTAAGAINDAYVAFLKVLASKAGGAAAAP